MRRLLAPFTVVAFLASILAGWVAAGSGFVSAQPQDPARKAEVAKADAPPQPPLMLCAGGLTGPLDVEIAPTRTVATAGGDRLRYEVRLHNRTSGDLRARYALEIVTDVGAPVYGPETSALLVLGDAATNSDGRETPALADGYYIVRVTAVATGTEADAAEIVHLYLHVSGGSLAQLDAEEFYGQSNANAAVMR